MAVAQGRHGQASGNDHPVDRQADRAGRDGSRAIDAGRRDVDRGRGGAPRKAGGSHGMKLEPPVPRKRRIADPTLRRVVLAGQPVDYRLIRARRRSIGMEVHFEGLTVRAPRWVTLRDIEATLVERAAWIVRSLAEWRARRRDVMPREWISGAPIAFRGAALTLALYPARHAEI